MARILVVDDSIVARKNIVTILTKEGHTIVGEAINGGQAHSMYLTHLPDLVTMDITMPGVNGIDAVKLIMHDQPGAKIIMVSALAQRNMVFEALELGAKHYLVKPITPESVKTVVNKVLGIAVTSQNDATPKVNSQSDVGEKVEQETQQPFSIESVNNTFQIRISKYLTENSINSLKQAVQGLLFVKPLNVVVDFGTIETLPDTLINKIGDVTKAIKGVNGAIRIVAQNKDLVLKLIEKKIEGILSQPAVSNTKSDSVGSAAVGGTPLKTATPSNHLFPSGHKHYSLESAGPIDNFIYVKKTKCPVCNTAIEIQIVRFTKLSLEKSDHDFRKHFIGFEPLWYSVQICPHCYYSSFAEEFDKVTDKLKGVILENASKFTIEVIQGQRNINQVFTSYYLMLHWLKEIPADKSQESKLWLRLGWLYEDVNDLELSKMAFEKALILYKDLFQNSRSQTTVEQDQRMTMLLGELCVRNGLVAEAHKYFRDTVVNKGGNNVMNEAARDRIQDIRA